MSDHTTRPSFITLHKNANDITGKRFGRLVALGPVGRARDKHVLWLYQCDCGNTHVTVGGIALSCGCQGKEKSVRRLKTHGMSRDHLYTVWAGIVRRCTNSKTAEYPRYGGRGITLLDEWRHSFEAFRDYVLTLQNCGEKGYTLDRINNDGNYEPDNLRFATAIEQGRNKCNNRLIKYEGKTQCLRAWEEELGFRKGTLQGRIDAGWPLEKAMTQPVRSWQDPANDMEAHQ